MENSKLITEYIKTYAKLSVNMNTGYAIDRLSKKERKLQAEMVERGIITKEQAEELNK